MGELPFAVVLIGLPALLLGEWLLGEVFFAPGRLLYGRVIKPEHLPPGIRGNRLVDAFLQILLTAMFWAVVWGAAYVGYHAYRHLA